ncbi:MAG: hypothetical protein AAF221_03635 [Pseudomonadota bacterium]
MVNDAPHKSDRHRAAKVQQKDATQEAAAAFFDLWQNSLKAAATPFSKRPQKDA